MYPLTSNCKTPITYLTLCNDKIKREAGKELCTQITPS